MRLLILSYHGLRESLLGAAEALKRLEIQVSDFPINDYSWSPVDRNSSLQQLINAIETIHPQAILMWSTMMDLESIQDIRARYPGITLALFNWDDPYAWCVPEVRLSEKAKCLDVVFTSCQESCSWYLQQGVKRSQFLLPGFDPRHHYPVDMNLNSLPRTPEDLRSVEYDCDVSLCVTNLYSDVTKYPDQLIGRHELVEMLTRQNNFTFRLYGPPTLGNLYPQHYGGWVYYTNLAIVFSRSRINLCTHVCGKWKYANERSILISAARGLLLVDPVSGFDQIFSPQTECVFLDLKDPIGHIRKILSEYDTYIPLRQAGYRRALSNYTWDHWAQQVKFTLTSS